MSAKAAINGTVLKESTHEPNGLEQQKLLQRQVRRFMSQNGNGRQTVGKIVRQFRLQEGEGTLKQVRAAVRQIRRDDRAESRATIKADHFAPFPGIRRDLNLHARLTQCQ
jgi:TPP-dependent indolepyruvate ferredoxin oxidoreductase alpha subunit